MLGVGSLWLWQSTYRGWLLASILLLGHWAASAPAHPLPPAVGAATAAALRGAAGSEGAAPAAGSLTTPEPSRADAASFRSTEQQKGTVDYERPREDRGAWQLGGAAGTAGSAGPGFPPSPSPPTTSAPQRGKDTEDEESESSGGVSLVPLFVLLASFLLIIVSCVVVCQRIRNSHKNRYHREEHDYRVQAAAYQRVLVACDAAPGCVDMSTAQNGKQPSLDSNCNVRGALVKFVDDTGLTASIVTCVLPSKATVGGGGGGGEKRRSCLVDRESMPLIAIGTSATGQAPSSGSSGAAAAAAAAVAADATTDVQADSADGKVAQTPVVLPATSSSNGGGSSHHGHSVTFSDVATTAGVQKASSLKCVKVSRSASPPPPGPRSPSGANAGKGNVTFHVTDGKVSRVAFFDASGRLHEPVGRGFKVVRMRSLPSGSSTPVLSTEQHYSLGNGASRSSSSSKVGGRGGGSGGRRKRSAGSSPTTSSASSGRSSPPTLLLRRDRVQKAVGGDQAAALVALAADQKPAARAFFSAAVTAGTVAAAAVKRRYHGSEGRPARRRPLSAAPRLVGAGARLHSRQYDSLFGDASYEPDDGEDFDDESETDFAGRCRHPGGRLAPLTTAVQRAVFVGSSRGDS